MIAAFDLGTSPHGLFTGPLHHIRKAKEWFTLLLSCKAPLIWLPVTAYFRLKYKNIKSANALNQSVDIPDIFNGVKKQSNKKSLRPKIQNHLKFLLLLLILCLPAVSLRANAASFYMDGVCYSDITTIASIWDSKFPEVNGATNMINISQLGTAITAAGVMTYRIDQQNISTGVITLGSVNTVQLKNCTAQNSLMATGRTDRTLVIFAMILFFILGFNFGHRFYSNNVVGE